LLAFARKQAVSPKILNINDAVSGTLKMLQRLIGEDISLAWLPGFDLWSIKIDSSQLDQILANLCVNARDSITDIGKISIETKNSTIDYQYCASHTDAVPGEYVCLSVSDTGHGIDKETLTHIFEPFFTTKEVGKGTGLGLATIYGAVKKNKGFINVYSEPSEGTIFTIYFPKHEDNTTREDRVTISAQVRHGQETILLVEDEPNILYIISQQLKMNGYNVLTADSPNKAIIVAYEYEGDIHVLMTDVIMPEMNGRDLSRNIQSIHPNIKLLFMSGYTADIISNHGVLEEGVHFIQKPFNMNALATYLRELLDS
jgi:CheY-like chemotaxis protein